MPDSDRGKGTQGLSVLIAAVTGGVVCAVILFVAGQIKADYEHRAYSSSRHQYATEQHIHDTCMGLESASLLKCVTEAVEANREDQRSEKDVGYQGNMSIAAWAMFFTSLAALLMTGVGIYLLWRTLDATRYTLKQAVKATGEARRGANAAETQTRAHLIIVEAKSSPLYNALIHGKERATPHATRAIG